MADLFKRTELNFGGAMASDKGLLTPNRGLTGVLMQGMQINYAQSVTRIYEIGQAGKTSNVYYIGGRAQGSLSVNHIIGPALTMQEFYNNFSDVCQARSNSIEIVLQANCGDTTASQKIVYTAKYCVLVNVGLSLNSQEFVIGNSSQLMFSNLAYAERGVNGAVAATGVGSLAA